MEQLIGLLIFGAIALAVSAVKWWTEKREREAVEARTKHAGRDLAESAPPRPAGEPPAPPPADRRPPFYDRPGEVPPPPAPEMPTLIFSPPVPAPPVPPGVEVVQRVIRRKVARPAPPPAEAEPALEAVGALARRHIEAIKEQAVSSIEGRRIQGGVEGARQAPAPGPAVSPGAPWLADALRGGNAARAVILMEVLGPPRAFRDY